MRPRTWDEHPPLIPAPQDLFLIRHIRAMRSRCWSEGRPAYRAREIDRGCPLGTGVDPSMWHADGTTSKGRPGRSASLPGAIGWSFIRTENLVLAVLGPLDRPAASARHRGRDHDEDGRDDDADDPPDPATLSSVGDGLVPALREHSPQLRAQASIGIIAQLRLADSCSGSAVPTVADAGRRSRSLGA